MKLIFITILLLLPITIQRYRKLESDLKCDSTLKFTKDAIMEKLVNGTRCLSSRLNGEKHQQNQGVKYEKDLLENSSITNPFKYDGGNITSKLASDKEHISKVQNNNPFKKRPNIKPQLKR